MKTLEVIAQQVLQTIDQMIPAVTSPERGTAAGACVVALYHTYVAVAQKPDHLRARQCLMALQPFRSLAENPSSRFDLICSGYTCAAMLKGNGIDQASYVNEMIARLGPQLSEETRKFADHYVKEHSEGLLSFRPANDHEGWFMVLAMINGTPYGNAFLDLHESKVAAKEVAEGLRQLTGTGNGGAGNGLIGKALPNGGSLVVGRNSATVHFGLSGGSVTMVDGKLAYTFPR